MNIAFWFGFWTQTRPCLSHYSLFWTPKDFGHFSDSHFFGIFSNLKYWSLTEPRAFDLQSCFFLFLQRPRNNNDSLIVPVIVFFLKKKRCGLKKEIFQFHFLWKFQQKNSFFLLRRNMIFVQKWHSCGIFFDLGYFVQIGDSAPTVELDQRSR